MPTPARISVVTRTCDRPDALRRAAAGLRAQTQAFEWIVVNDGTGAVNARELQGVGTALKVIDTDDKLGRSQAATVGIEAASGDFVMLHDDDDALLPDALQRLAGVLSDGDAIAVTCGYETLEERADGSIVTTRTHLHGLPPRLYDLAERNSLLTIGTLFRKKTYDKIGGMNTAIDALEDWDLWLRLMTVGDIAVVDDILARQYVRPEGTLGAAANSDVDEHAQARVRLQNAYLRDDIAAGRIGLGDLMHRPHARFVEEVNDRLSRAGKLKRKLMPWRRTPSQESEKG